ncbi:hypothetical protein OAF22_02135, partial [bacterium]|nr:hypothetical protein [bacterium]
MPNQSLHPLLMQEKGQEIENTNPSRKRHDFTIAEDHSFRVYYFRHYARTFLRKAPRRRPHRSQPRFHDHPSYWRGWFRGTGRLPR